MPTNNPLDYQVCENLGNANSTPIQPCGVSANGVRPGYNPFVVYCWGTFSGNTAKLQVSPDEGTTWLDYPGATFTAAGIFTPVYLGTLQFVRCINTGGSISMTLSSVQ